DHDEDHHDAGRDEQRRQHHATAPAADQKTPAPPAVPLGLLGDHRVQYHGWVPTRHGHESDQSSAVLVNRYSGFPSSVRWSRHERVGRQPNSFCALAVSMPEASGRETGRSAVVDPGYAAFHDADRSREPIVSAAAM